MTPHHISEKQENVRKTLSTERGQAVDRLPVEILSYIFLLCLPIKTSGFPTLASPKEAPLSICHVSSSWRQVALQTSALWTSLVMKVSPEDSLLVPERYSQVTSFWFSQAGNRLIDLGVTCGDPIAGDGRFSANFMILLVQPREERIRSLYLSLEDFGDLCDFLQYQDEEDTVSPHIWNFPNLEYLTLGFSFYFPEHTVLSVFQSMPKLHIVTINDVTFSTELEIHLPWAQLTSLTIHTISETLFRILHTKCPALETGCFTIDDMNFDAELPTIDVTLTRLTTFAIHFSIPSDPTIFHGIQYPALDNLTLNLPHHTNNPFWIEPEHLFRQLAPITTLSLGGHNTSDMISILRETKNVTTFTVEFENEHEDVLRAMTLGGEDEEDLLPKLSVLRVQVCFRHCCGSFAVAAFVEMVASRSFSCAAPLGVAPLQEVWVGVPVNAKTLKVDLDAVLGEWAHKTDMPLVRYEERKMY